MYIFYFTLTLSTWKVKVVQLCLTLCNPMDCRLVGSSVHGDSPGKNTGVALPFSMGSSQPRDWTWVSCGSCIAGGFFTFWATREALKKMEENVKNFVKWYKNNSFIILHKNCFLCHITARRSEKAKNRKINITMFSTSALCLTHHWNIPVSTRERDRTRPTCPRSKAKWGRRGIKLVDFSTPHTGPSVTLQRWLLYFYDFYWSI